MNYERLKHLDIYFPFLLSIDSRKPMCCVFIFIGKGRRPYYVLSMNIGVLSFNPAICLKISLN